jgi:polysaccharide biosynthesis protein PslH
LSHVVANILYLVHRLPYPPNKGDKVRSYHLLKHLRLKHRVFLGTFIDDAEDEQYVDSLRVLCADLHVARLKPRVARLTSLRGLLTGEALTLPYYRDSGLQRWVDLTIRDQAIDAVVVFSSAMAQYVDVSVTRRVVVDFVDVDSAKWTQYASSHRWPLSWLYRREGARLLAFERAVAARAQRSFFVTESETKLFRQLAPEVAGRIEPICNGVNAEFFSPQADTQTPYAADELPVVFTGAMDYWPNVDAVTWFVREVLPLLQDQRPAVRFWIVGRSPAPVVQALAGQGVVVTGTVSDVRPYLQHAAVVVAPLRVARGIQNKILEAMAMARAVVASTTCAGAIDAELGRDLLAAESAADFAVAVDNLLKEPGNAEAIGASARQRVLDRYSWEAHMSGIDHYLMPNSPAQEAA